MNTNMLSFLGNFAGRSANEWKRKAAEWALTGNHASNVIDCCYNAAKAALGNNATWAQIQAYAQALIHSLIR